MNKLSSLARLGALAAAVSGTVLVGSIQDANAGTTSQAFTVSGDVADLCTISNVAAGTMGYDFSNDKLTTEGNTRPGFTVNCNADITQINYDVAITASPTAAAETTCSLALVADGAVTPGTLTDVADCVGTGNFTTIDDVDGRSNTPPIAGVDEDGEIVFEVSRDAGALDAGTHTYAITLTWVP